MKLAQVEENNPYWGAEEEEEQEFTPEQRGDVLVDDSDDEVSDDMDKVDLPAKEGTSEASEQETDGEEVEEDGEEEVEEEADEETEEEVDEESEEEDEETAEQDTRESDPESERTDTDERESRRSRTIPRTRYDQVNNKFNQAKDRIAELEAQLQQGDQTTSQQQATENEVQFQQEVMETQSKIHDLLLDGDSQEASRQQAELNQRIMERAMDRAREQAKVEVSQTFAQREYERTLSTLETNFPFINPDNADSFDESMVTRVKTITQSLIASEGYTPSEALQEATETVAARYFPDLLQEEAPAAPEQQRPAREVTEKRVARRKRTIKRNAEAAQRQPARVSGDPTATARDHTPNIFQMTEEEFDNLSESELARLRGDFVE